MNSGCTLGRRDTLVAATVTFVAVALGASVASAQLANSYWPVFQQNNQHTGQSPINGPTASNTAVKWTYKGYQRLLGAPSVGADGTIYIGNGKAPMCAVEPSDGTEVFCTTNRRGGDAAQSSPAISADGMVYSGARDNDLWATRAQLQVNPDDQVLWRFHVPYDGDVTAPPIIGPDGIVYFASNAIGLGFVFAWYPVGPEHPDGATNQKWFRKLGVGVLNSAPTLSLNGDTVYFSTTDSSIRALRTSDGQDRWTIRVFKGANGFRQSNFTIVVGPDGRLYVGARDGLHVVQANPANDGATEVANFPTDGRMESSPALASDGTLYFGASRRRNGTFYSVDSTQLDPADPNQKRLKMNWSMPLFGRFKNNQAAVGANGDVYVAVGKTVYAFHSDGTPIWDYTVISGQIVTGPIIGAPGVLYLAAPDRLLYAFEAPGP